MFLLEWLIFLSFRRYIISLIQWEWEGRMVSFHLSNMACRTIKEVKASTTCLVLGSFNSHREMSETAAKGLGSTGHCKISDRFLNTDFRNSTRQGHDQSVKRWGRSRCTFITGGIHLRVNSRTFCFGHRNMVLQTIWVHGVHTKRRSESC